MATRSKNKKLAAFWSLLVVAALALCCFAGARFTYENMESDTGLYYQESFTDNLYAANYTLYWEAQQAWQKTGLAPSQVLLQPRAASESAAPSATDGSGEATDAGVASGSLFTGEPEDAFALEAFDNSVRSHADALAAEWGNLYYAVTDEVSGSVYSNAGDDFPIVADGNGSVAFQRMDGWRYALALRFDESGTLHYIASALTEGDGENYSFSIWSDISADAALSAMQRWYDLGALEQYTLTAPTSVTIVYAVPRELAAADTISWYLASRQSHLFSARFAVLFLAAAAGAALAALWFGRKRGSGLGGERLCRAPLELILAVLLCTALFANIPALLAASVFDGSVAGVLRDAFSVDSPPIANTLANLLCAGLVYIYLEAVFLSALALVQGIHRDGWKGYPQKRSLVVRGLRRIWHIAGGALKRLWRTATSIDLRDPAEKTLVRLLAVNFVIVTVICCFWFFGILGTLIYSVVLFFLLRRRTVRIQKDYTALLNAAGRMADGDLDTPIVGDLGLFDPLKEQLNQVRDGFKKAVAAEVRSQNMKTELITNVSHDLKTPLTAIITYVDLLKDPALSAEDRAKYIETLDKKSQRLRRLIEDLFEVSKAATQNVTMHYVQMDLTALLKQVQYELADKTEACGVDFRWQLPDSRLQLVLDGQKTCRIFENLIVNITKYGMPGTRAYITLTPLAHGAQITFKNVSATELDFSEEEITERFVRGDRSRNTEGSGLGLAIAKSFTELQGGAFAVSVDGDLFKAVVTLPDSNIPEQPGQPGPGPSEAGPPEGPSSGARCAPEACDGTAGG